MSDEPLSEKSFIEATEAIFNAPWRAPVYVLPKRVALAIFGPRTTEPE